MVNEKTCLKDKEYKLVEQIFCTSLSYQALQQKTSKQQVVFNDIVQFVKGNVLVEQQPIIAAINSHLSLRRVYLQLLQQCKFAESGLQAAASSGEELPIRITEQFSLKFKRDKNTPTQVYVILAIDHPKEHHNNKGISLHITTNDNVQCVLFPKLIDNSSQLMMDDDDSAFKLLIDRHSELFLL